MGRRILFEHGEVETILEEQRTDERELQEAVKRHPELLPIEDLGMAGPLLVIGRETPLPSGQVDLVGLTRGGELVLVEFKVGPENPDFRHATSQLVDYGSDLWGRAVGDLEREVALRYFQGPRCPRGSPGHGAPSLQDAARRAWPDLGEDGPSILFDRLARVLEGGEFHYVVAAQRFPEPALRTIEYLNAISRASFYAVEVVRFVGAQGAATEARVLHRPGPRRTRAAASIDEGTFLERVEDPAYREALGHVLEAARNLGYRISWGVRGGVIKLPTQDHPDPLSVGWVFDDTPGNWNGLRNLTLGHQPRSLELRPSVREAVSRYQRALAEIPGAKRIETAGQDLLGYGFDQGALPANETAVIDRLAALARDVQEGTSGEGTSDEG